MNVELFGGVPRQMVIIVRMLSLDTVLMSFCGVSAKMQSLAFRPPKCGSVPFLKLILFSLNIDATIIFRVLYFTIILLIFHHNIFI